MFTYANYINGKITREFSEIDDGIRNVQGQFIVVAIYSEFFLLGQSLFRILVS